MTQAIDVLTGAVEKLSEQVKELGSAIPRTEEEIKERDEKMSSLEDRMRGLEDALAEQKQLSVVGLEVSDPKRGPEKDKFSFARFAKAVARPKLFENAEYGVEADMVRAIQDAGLAQKFAINAGTDAEGAYLLSTEVMGEILPELEAVSVAAQAGVQQIFGLTDGAVQWLTDEGGIGAEYLNTEEEETGDETKPTFGQVEIRPHPLAAFVPLSWGMMNLPTFALESWVRSRMVKKIALREDLSVFLGRGSNGEPRGVWYAPGIGTLNWSTIDTNTHPEFGRTTNTQNISLGLRSMAKVVAKANGLAGARRPGFVMSVDLLYAISNTIDDNGMELFTTPQAGIPQSFVNYAAYSTTQVDADSGTAQVTAAGLTSSDEFCVFGDYDQILNPHWGTVGFASSAETETNFRKGRTTLRAITAHDVGVLEPQAFCKALNFVSSET